MNILFLADDGPSLLEALGKAFGSATSAMFWVVVVLITLFILSRFNNYMEVRGVNRAIGVTRAFVGSIMYFVIAPIVLFILLNIISLVYGAGFINAAFLGNWLALTATSYWWLLLCAFNSEFVSPEGMEVPTYSVHSIVRILWILVPLTLIWLRTAKKRFGKLLLLPFIIMVVVVTRNKVAQPTFLTRDDAPAVVAKIKELPVINLLFDESEEGGNPDDMFTPLQRKIIAAVLILMVAGGLVAALGAKQRVVGLILTAAGVVGFIFIAPPKSSDNILIPKNKTHPYHSDIDSLTQRLDSIYVELGPEAIEVYELTVKINNAYSLQKGKWEFPDSLCQKYEQFFYDRCRK